MSQRTLSEDWIKRKTWDLPTSLVSLYAALGVSNSLPAAQRQALRKLRRTPAYFACPLPLKKTIELTLKAPNILPASLSKPAHVDRPGPVHMPLAKGVIPIVTKAYNPEEARGQPENAGEWASSPGGNAGSVTQPASKTPIPVSLIQPHNVYPTGLNEKGNKYAPGKGPHDNPTATQFDTLPEEYRTKILDQVHTFSPNGDLTERMPSGLLRIDEYLDDNWKQAQTDPTAVAARTWYNDANKNAAAIAKKVGLDMPRAVGFVAALSPRCSWPANLLQAQFYADALKKDAVVDIPPELIDELHTKSMKSKGIGKNVTIPTGKRLSEMTRGQQAWALMALVKMAPGADGTLGLTTDEKNKDGTPTKCALSGANSIGKALDIYYGGSPDKALNGHKVRSFYNNILDPDNTGGKNDVTIDTHAVSAASHAVMGATSKALKYMFARSSASVANVEGAYAFFADAYRRLAERHQAEMPGLTAAQAQAIVWTAWRSQGQHTGYDESFDEVK